MQKLRQPGSATTALGARVGSTLSELPVQSSVAGRGQPQWCGPLALADVVGLLAAFLISESVVPVGASGRLTPSQEFLVLLVTIPGWVGVASMHGLYGHEDRADHSTPDELAAIFHLTTIGTWLLGLLLWVTGLAHPDVAKLAVFWLTATASIGLARVATRMLLHRRRSVRQNTVIYGAGEAGQLVARKILSHPEYGWNLLCFVDPDPMVPSPQLAGIPVLRRPETLWDLSRNLRIDRVIFAFSRERDARHVDLAHALRARGIHVDVVPRLYEITGVQAELHTLEALPLVGLRPVAARNGQIFKRAFDLGMATVALLLLLPLLAVVAAVIKLDSRGPVLFASERVGRGASLFYLLKFRTMRVGADSELDALLEDEPARAEFEQTHKLRNDPRVTRIGSWLRRTSLDELPQLVNILRGELSLVGPRPITTLEYHEFVTECEGEGSWTGVDGYWAIPELRPGLTGLWQINGRSAIGYDERVRLDKLYAANRSMGLDLLILAKTVRSVFSAAGAR